MDCCSECENIRHDQDGEESADCSDDSCKCHLELAKRIAEKNLFQTVYNWGRAGIITDENCNTFQSLLSDIRNF